jgi:acyl-CoA thioester hydrolase
MRQTGVTYKEMEERDKAMLPVIEAHVDYSKPARYDDELTIYGWLAAAGGVRIKVCCVVMRGDELLASGYTVHACVSTENMRPMRLPSYIVEHIVAE